MTTLNITGDPAADELLSTDAFALLVGMLLDQQVPMETAFAGPLKIQQRVGSIIVWGSLTLADTLFAAGLVDELRLRVVPMLIGAGRSFTPAGLGARRLRLDEVVTHPGGLVTLQYAVH